MIYSELVSELTKHFKIKISIMKPEGYINFSAVSRLMAGHRRSINKGKLDLISAAKREHIQELIDYVERWERAWKVKGLIDSERIDL